MRAGDDVRPGSHGSIPVPAMRCAMRWVESGGAAAPHVRPGFPAEYRRRRGRSGRRALCSRRRLRRRPVREGPRRPPQAGARAVRRWASLGPHVACSRAASSRAPRLRRFEPESNGATETAVRPGREGEPGNETGMRRLTV